MRGIVFTEFLDLVEDNFGYETVDKIIAESDLPSGGVYTSIGTYPHREMAQLVMHLSKTTQIPIADLLQIYGKHFFSVLARNYPHFLDAAPDAFALLESIDSYIHVEVRKLYPDAELPRFETKRLDNATLEMIYRSERRMADFAVGLTESCLKHYNETGKVEKNNLNEDGTIVQLLVTKTVA